MMKQQRRSILLSLVLAVALCITGASMGAFAKESDTPVTTADDPTVATSVTGMHMRGPIMLFLSGEPYADVSATTAMGDKLGSVNLLENITLYTLDGTSKTLSEVWDENSANAYFNIWGEKNCVAINFKNANNYNGLTVWKVEIAAGTQFPGGGSDSPMLVTESATTLYNTYSTYPKQESVLAESWSIGWSADESAVNTTNKASYKADWDKEHPPVDPGRTEPIQTPVAIYDTKNGIAQLHFRGEIKENGAPDIKMLIFLNKSDYEGATVGINNGAAEYADYYNDYNTMDKIRLWTSETESITLKQAFTSTGATHEAYYNIWGESNCVAFQLGQYKADDFVRVTISEGCEFPSYQHTSGKEKLKDVFVTTQTVEFIDWSPSPDFSTNWRVDRSRGEILVDSIACDGQGKVSFTLNGTDYASAQEETNLETMAETTNLYQNVSIDGKTLESYIGESMVNGYAAQNGTFSLTVPGLTEARKIIIKQGAQFPAYNNSEMNVACYNVGYYETKGAVMFVKNAQGVWEKAEQITWTVTFDGANAVEVADGAVVPADKIPAGDPQAGHRIEWMSGQVPYDFTKPVKGDLKLTSSQVRQYTLSFDVAGGSAVDAVTVDEGVAAQKPADPTRKGYTFGGWFVGDTEYNFNTPLSADVTVKAKWVADKSQKKRGCGSVLSVSGIALAAGALALLGVLLTVRKKKVNE